MLISVNLSTIASQAVQQIEAQLPARAMQAAHILKNSSQEILGHEGGGKTYRKPAGGTYKASSPGDPPAARTHVLQRSLRPIVYGAHNPGLEGGTPYAGFMEYGTPGGMIAPRPYIDKIVELSEPEIVKIYEAPYNISIK